jgi:trehalose-6-phosphate synthase
MSVLKPAMHNVLETGAQHMFPYASSLDYLKEGWELYQKANKIVSDVVFNQYNCGDVIWIHDYQLCMVPKFMTHACKSKYKERPPQVFFMHSPFPTSEIFRTLPVRDELLRKCCTTSGQINESEHL